MLDTHMFSLPGMQQELEDYIDDGALMMYWSYHINKFDYLKAEDHVSYRAELKRIKKSIKNGTMISVKAGDPITVNDTSLYPILLEWPDTECPAYFLLSETGLYDLVAYTPYFFRTESKRDQVLAYLLN